MGTTGFKRAYITECGELRVGSGRVLGGIVREDSDAVEGAVILWVVQPTLEAVGAVPPDANADNVRGTAHGHLVSQLLKRSARQVGATLARFLPKASR